MPAAKPFTVIGGFLGAGKTTLINRILAQSQGVRYALLVNDFGAINIDEKLVQSHDGQTLSLANGCICCSLADGFINTMLRLMQQPDTFDHVVVECSGVSRPDRIMDFARIDPALSVEATLVLVDAASIEQQLGDAQIESVLRAQIEAADLLLLNKADLVDRAALDRLATRLAQINGRATRFECQRAQLPLSVLLGSAAAAVDSRSVATADAVVDSPLDDGFDSQSLRREQPLDFEAFEQFAQALPVQILRGKGLVLLIAGNGVEAWLWQRVGQRNSLQRWRGEMPPQSEIALIAAGPMPALSGAELFSVN